ncbi:MAG: hypothetical protein ACLQT6_04985, partial [Desulfomonilaceae bacterium]
GLAHFPGRDCMTRGYHAVGSQYLGIKTFEWIRKRSMAHCLCWERKARAVYWVITEAAMKLDGAPVPHNVAFNDNEKSVPLTE